MTTRREPSDDPASDRRRPEHGRLRSGARSISRPRTILERAVEAWVTRVAKRPWRTLAWLAIVTALAAGGLTRLRFETGVLDWLPSGHPNVQAFGRLLERLDGITNQELLWVELDPSKAEAAGVRAIHDPDAVRAQAELIEYVRERVPRVRHAFGLPHWFGLVQRASQGPPAETDAELRLPETDAEFRFAWQAIWTTNQTLVGPTISADERGTYVGLVIEESPLSRPAREVGAEIEAAVAAYRDDADRAYDLFRDERLVPVGLASGTSLIDRTLRTDLLRLVPIAIAIIVASLVLAFRRPVVAGAGLLQVLVGVVWTYGAMGYAGVPINVVNIALVPLALGCGVDYAIHFLNEYGQRRGDGTSRIDALGEAARASGVGIVLTTLTTSAGLLSLVIADIPGMVQLGLFAAFGMIVLAMLSLTFLPAVLALQAPRETAPRLPESAPIGRAMEAVARRPRLAYALFAIVTLAAAFATGESSTMLDPVRGNFRPEEPVMQTVSRMQEKAGGAFPDFIIVEGDLADPRSVAAMRRLHARLSESDALSGGVASGSYVDALAAYELLRDGSMAAIPKWLGAKGDPIAVLPETRDDLAASMRGMAKDVGWRPVSDLFYAGTDIGVAILMVRESTFDDLDGAERFWDELSTIVEEENTNNAGGDRELAAPIRFSFLGYRTMAYLFFAESVRWLRVLFATSFVAAMVLIAIFLRDRRALLAIGSLMLATGVWWLGLLRIADIHVSIFLLFPLIFVISIGSDYGLHLCWRLSRGEPRTDVWRTTGRAISLSAVTDGAVFALFITVGLLSASHVMAAVVLAVASVFAATVLLVPAAYGASRSES